MSLSSYHLSFDFNHAELSDFFFMLDKPLIFLCGKNAGHRAKRKIGVQWLMMIQCMIKIVNGRIVVSISIFIETVMMICCVYAGNAGNLAGCCMFPDMGYVSVSLRFIVVVVVLILLDPFVVAVLLYWWWWLFTDDENMVEILMIRILVLWNSRVWEDGWWVMMMMMKVWIEWFFVYFWYTNIAN